MLGNRRAETRADNAHLNVADSQPLFDHHSDHIAGSKASRISNQVYRVLYIIQDRADCQDA